MGKGARALAKIIEPIIRTVNRFNPKTYDRKSRIRRIVKCQISHDTKNFAVVVYNESKFLQKNISALLRALNQKKYNILLVSNVTPKRNVFEQIKARCSIFMERANLGRDFGAYKDAILYLKEINPEIDRLIFCNDSVFYIDEKLDDYLDLIDDEQDIVGMTESYVDNYHLQSYFIYCGKRALDRPEFWLYWQKYLPLNTRPWAIKRGELGFSKFMSRAQIELNATHNVPLLIKNLNKLDSNKWPVLYDSLSKHVQDSVTGTLKSRFNSYFQDSATLFDRSSLRENYLKALRREMAVLAAEGSQVHKAMFVYCLLGLPIIKRDICYRGEYQFGEALDLYQQLNIGNEREFKVILFEKGKESKLKYSKNFLKKLDII